LLGVDIDQDVYMQLRIAPGGQHMSACLLWWMMIDGLPWMTGFIGGKIGYHHSVTQSGEFRVQWAQMQP
jgi:hypothetical protein